MYLILVAGEEGGEGSLAILTLGIGAIYGLMVRFPSNSPRRRGC